MAARDLVVVGASAGGIEALEVLVSRLPESFSASMFVCVHISSRASNSVAKQYDLRYP